MKLLGFKISFQKGETTRSLLDGLILTIGRLEGEIVSLDERLRETEKKAEAIRRKVYRDADKVAAGDGGPPEGSGPEQAAPVLAPKLRTGDPAPY